MNKPSRAVVIGGGLAGLLSARVLADHFERVVLLDGDLFPEGPESRRQVPQDHHSHVLLARGRLLYEQLFPGLDSALEAGGCSLVDWCGDCEVYSSAGLVPRFPSAMLTRPCTRPFLEWHVRRRVAALPNVELRGGVKATGLVGAGARVTAVTTMAEPVEADWFVDASGRHSQAAKWLEALGFSPPLESVVDSHLGYATRLYARASAPSSWKAVMINTAPPSNPRAGAAWPVEGDRWLVTLAGAAHTYPPTDEAGFRQFAQGLQSPRLLEIIDHARPLTPIQGYRRTENQWRHFEAMPRSPERFVVLGDAVCAFNPIYGQGMSVAGLEAEAMGRLLGRARSLDGVAKRIQRALPKLIEPAWLIATGEDSRWPTTSGASSDALTRFSHWYVSHLMALTPRSPRMVNAFLSVVHLLKSPAALFHPVIAAQVLAHALRHSTETRPVLDA